MSRVITLAVIPGDGIGPEIITEAQRILTRACELENITVNPTQYKLGAEHWLETGETLPESPMESLKQHDAILLGAVGGVPGEQGSRLVGAPDPSQDGGGEKRGGSEPGERAEMPWHM